MKILIETSARHVHLSLNDFETLFGKNAKLTLKKNLSQPGQFACFERVNVISAKSEISNVSILGPFRDRTQVEISLTDSIKLGIYAPIRLSGNISNTPGCTLVGPKGKINLSNGVIVAKRHIHLDLETAQKFNLKNNQNVKVNVKTEFRSLAFDDVTIRIDKNFSPAMHIDTDEANAAGIKSVLYGDIII